MSVLQRACNYELFKFNFQISFVPGKDEREDRITDISLLYQIFPEEVLGSGQFGIVYGGKLHQNMVYFM